MGYTQLQLANTFKNLEQLFMKDPQLALFDVITRNSFKLKEITIYGRLTQRYFEIRCFPQVKMLDMRELVMEFESEINVKRVKVPKRLSSFSN